MTEASKSRLFMMRVVFSLVAVVSFLSKRHNKGQEPADFLKYFFTFNYHLIMYCCEVIMTKQM